MRRITFYALCAMAIVVTSCGTSKNAAPVSKVTGDQLIEANPCEEYAMEKPAQRASGMGQHFQETTARNQAELQARTALARALQVCVEETIKDYADGTTLFSANESESTTATDQSAMLNNRIEGMTKELIKGAPVVKVTKYRTPNNQYKVYVCVEYSDDVAQMAGKVAKSFSELLTDEQKLRVKFSESLFKKEMEEKMKNYSGATMQ